MLKVIELDARLYCWILDHIKSYRASLYCLNFSALLTVKLECLAEHAYSKSGQITVYGREACRRLWRCFASVVR